ncbi:hypothetical protein K1T71_010930 [Dendrolimus kikuchii]|uniref:Uncharacterized protein n=1 Tax=Dendrolimus kikuchii TaxID=765133 RepID=A0ACC1CQL6_9NEOP|nr:hypothetical protein K1T71_010930 [Dendrolimus kikuchii]
MRRGRSGIGGWRNDNPRHFRPRSGGPQYLRHPRNYGLLDGPRFPPIGALSNRPPHFVSHPSRASKINEPSAPEIHERNKYNSIPNTQHRQPDRGQFSDRHTAPYFHKHRQNNDRHYNSHKKNTFRESDETFQGSVNDLGDVDHRLPPNIADNRDNYGKRHSTWVNPVLENKRQYYDRTPHRYSQNHEDNETQKLSFADYTGHRPPSSDHYRGSSNPTNNNTAFTRSVDDTVDIIRKRLRDRSDGHLSCSQESTSQDKNDEKLPESSKPYSENQQDQLSKRRIQRPAQVISNCDKIKSNIVHQLFKMDKNKIHKLMDNPSSSTKFEYAISSLITESQNSLNKQLRSVAEKSLNNSCTNYISDDNNTIYEDTFMKQMQCLLDPQDTVFLEDIKPIVMAELNKVLQVDEYDQDCDIYEENQTSYESNEQSDYTYCSETSNYEDQPYNYENKLYEQELASELYFNKSGDEKVVDNRYTVKQESVIESQQLYERRSTKPPDYSENVNVDRRYSTDSQRQIRKSIDTINEDRINTHNPVPLFDTNTEQFSEDEDPFAELDKQYHVAVDHNFINNDDFGSPAQSVTSSINKSPNIQGETTNKIPISSMNPLEIKKEIDSQLERLAKSPIKLQSLDISKENVSSTIKNETGTTQHYSTVETKKVSSTKPNELNDTEKIEHSSSVVKAFTPSIARKRSISQMPSHRKEKRKKSESNSTEFDQQSFNKNTSLPKSLDAAKLMCNISSTKETKDNSSDKTTIDKYVKRKTEPRKSKDVTNKKNNNNNVTSHSILSPKDSSSCPVSTETQSKSDAKNKLKTIDMFMDQPKKSTPLHQAHRNTAAASTGSLNKTGEENKIKLGIMKPNSKVSVNHVSTQVMRKVLTKEAQTTISRCSKSRFCQTERKKFTTRAVQTDQLSFGKTTSRASDCLERMKEIDLEIQVLLQEKFKLYNSIESKDSCQNTVQTLGMTVLSVTPLDDEKDEEDIENNTLSEDAIVDSFTSIPVEELEQIALETVQNENTDFHDSNTSKRSRKPSVRDLERSSSSPTVTKSGRKVKPPNISLLEQIITSDKPLEDIIVLDELESSPVKPVKKKSQKRPVSKKKSVKKPKSAKSLVDYSSFKLQECSVLLERQDVSQYLIDKSDLIQLSDLGIERHSPLSLNSMPEIIQSDFPEKISYVESKPQAEEKALDNVRQEVIPVNDIQLDMLDVSEDIVIGDVCEVKCDDSSDQINHEFIINEEIILDNSQSSCEEITSDASQEDIICKMFDYSTDENLSKDSITVSGNADSILAIESIENNFLAACLDGNVYHFNGDGQLLSTLRGSNLAVTCLTVVKEKFGTTVYTGSLDSRIRYYDLETGLEKGLECNVLSPIQTMDRAWDTVFVGTRTGFVLQFECKNVTIKDAQTGLLLRTLTGPTMTVYTLLFEDGKVYCGTSSHQVHVFDYSSGSHVGTHEGGKGAVCLRACGGLLFAGCYDGCVYVYREGEPQPLAQLRGPSFMLLSLAIVGTKIIVGYKDRSLHIWKIPLSILKEMIL